MYNKFLKDDKGFTGLEAAIVLIAFVVVAAVFSYVMLGAGFFTTQKSQEVVHTGVTQASSSLALSGDVIAEGADATGAVAGAGGAADEITFYITNTAGGTPVDLDKTIITYSDSENSVTKSYAVTVGPPVVKGSSTIPAAGNALWAASNGWLYDGIIITDGLNVANAAGGIGDNLLSAGEKYKVVVDLPNVVANTAANPLPVINEKFTIQVKPPEGAVLSITRTLPAALATGSYYPVY